MMKNVFFNHSVLFALIIMHCCNCNPKNDEEKEVAHLKETVQDYFNTFNQHNWQKLSEFYQDTVFMKDPAFGLNEQCLSKTDIQAKYQQLHQMFPDVKDKIVQLYLCRQSSVVVEFISEGTDSVGNKFSLPVCTIFGFNNKGKISRDYTYYDNF